MFNKSIRERNIVHFLFFFWGGEEFNGGSYCQSARIACQDDPGLVAEVLGVP